MLTLWDFIITDDLSFQYKPYPVIYDMIPFLTHIFELAHFRDWGEGTLILSMEYKPDFLLYVCVKRICKTWISLVSGWQGSCQYEEWTAGKRASSAVLEINDNEAEFDELVVFPSPRSSMVWGESCVTALVSLQHPEWVVRVNQPCKWERKDTRWDDWKS